MNSPKRFLELDLLRAAMMLLGVIYHAVELVYASGNHLSHNIFVDAFLWTAHSFRMPVFFLVSGFLAASVLAQKGKDFFLANRIQRILLPLLLSLPLLLPLQMLMEYHEKQFFLQDPSLAGFLGTWKTALNFLYWRPKLHHLWFLSYLFLASLLLIFLRRYIRASYLSARGWLFFTCCMLFFSMSLMKTPGIVNSPTALLPNLPVFLYYFSYFFFGWIWRERDIEKSGLFIWLWFPISCVFLSTLSLPSSISMLLYPCFALSLTLYLFEKAQGIKIKPGLRHLISYGVDSAYWVFLAHFFILYPGDLLLMKLQISHFARLLLLLGFTYTLCFASYHFWVRYSWIGQILNGKRQKKAQKEIAFVLPEAALTQK
jgi:glucan biosynthesis protein C